MKALMQEFGEICRNRPTELAAAHAQGTKIVEYTGNYVPEELIYAAGAKPYPMWRGGEPEPPDEVLEDSVRFLNPLARSVAGFYYLGVDPVTPFADMIVTSLTDCHMYRIVELLEMRDLPILKIGVPTDWKQPQDFDYYVNKVRLFKDALEKLVGASIADDDINKQIGLTNQINGLLRDIDQLRKLPNPPISGYDFIKLNHYTALCEPEVAISMLSKILDKLEDPGARASHASDSRIVMAGRAVAIGDYIALKALEDAGCMVVKEFLDEAYRWFEFDTEVGDDPLTALCRVRYLDKPPTTNLQPSWEQRQDYLLKLVSDYSADGIVWYELLYDELHDMEYTCLARRLGEEGIPLIRIQTSYEYTREKMGPLNTKIDTFAAALKGAVA